MKYKEKAGELINNLGGIEEAILFVDLIIGKCSDIKRFSFWTKIRQEIK